MDKKRANASNSSVSSAKKRKAEFLFDDFIPFSASLPESRLSSNSEDDRQNFYQRKTKVNKELSNNGQRSNKKDESPIIKINANGKVSRKERKRGMEAMKKNRFDKTGSRSCSKISASGQPEVLNRNKRRKLNRKEDWRMKNQVIHRAAMAGNSPPRSAASSPEFNFKPPILISARPASLVKLQNASPVKLEDVAAVNQTTVDTDRASTITLDDDDEEGATNNRTSPCHSEESVDLNDLRSIEGYNDFNKCKVERDDEASSYSSYCTILDDSDEAECEPAFGCVSLNIDLSKKQKTEKSRQKSLEVAGSIGITNRLLPSHLLTGTQSKVNDFKQTHPNNLKCEFTNQSSNLPTSYPQYSNHLYDNRASKSVQPSSFSSNKQVDGGLLPDYYLMTATQGFGQADSSCPNDNETGWFVDRTNERDPSNETFPWVNQDRPYSGGIIGLHEEIEDFHEYSRLKPTEIQVRNLLFLKVKDVILTKWPNAEVLVFGSFQTGLSLPFADLDIVCLNIPKNEKIPFYQLEHRLVSKNITTYENVKIITKAAVPIIKFIHGQTGLSVDMSFKCDDGPKAIALIKEYIELYPALPKLLLIIKLMLHQRGLNFSYTGGLSSYSLTLMIVNFFQQHPRVNVIQNGSSNLGVLLLEFLELYGFTFDYQTYGIRVRDGEGYVRKSSMRCLSDHDRTLKRLAVEDPLDEYNNPSKNSHRWDDIRKAFRNSYNLLVDRCREMARPGSNQRSILGELISYTPGEVDIRRKVLEFHSQELDTIIKKRGRKAICFDFNRDFIPFSVPDEPLGGIDLEEEKLAPFR